MRNPPVPPAMLRVATYRYGDQNSSRPQHRLAEHIAAQPDWRLVDSYHDNTNPTRPVLCTALDDARFGCFDILLITGLDQLGERLWQITGLVQQLTNAGVQVITLDGVLDTSNLAAPVRLAALAWCAQVDEQLAAAEEEPGGPPVVWRLRTDDARAVHNCLSITAGRWEQTAAEATAGALRPPNAQQPSPGTIHVQPTPRGYTNVAALAHEQVILHRRLADALLTLIEQADEPPTGLDPAYTVVGIWQAQAPLTVAVLPVAAPCCPPRRGRHGPGWSPSTRPTPTALNSSRSSSCAAPPDPPPDTAAPQPPPDHGRAARGPTSEGVHAHGPGHHRPPAPTAGFRASAHLPPPTLGS
jgi:hypothetical protein